MPSLLPKVASFLSQSAVSNFAPYVIKSVSALFTVEVKCTCQSIRFTRATSRRNFGAASVGYHKLALFRGGNAIKLSQFRNIRPRPPCPTLCERCVGSFTSHRVMKAGTHEGACSRSTLLQHAPGAKLPRLHQRFLAKKYVAQQNFCSRVLLPHIKLV